MRFCRIRSMVAGTALMLLAVACEPGGDAGADTTVNSSSSTTTTTTSSTSTTSPPAALAADLNIVIGTADHPAEFEAALLCGPETAGTGYLADSVSAACDFLSASGEARALLLEGPEPNRACTEIYGGGEVAEITGTLNAALVDLAINRTNGCGISDWGVLQPLLVEPYDLERQNAAADCSGAAMSIDADVGELPPVVSDVRFALLTGAASCDLEGLATRALADGTNVSFGGSDDPAGLWHELESTGGTPMADLINVLQMTPGVTDDGQGTIFWVWPAVAAMDDWGEATQEQRAELADLFGADALADWDSFGGYIGYRVGITESGRWAFFVAGD